MLTVTGCTFHPERRIAHDLGDILHGMTRQSPGFCGFGEAYFTSILPGKIKGWRRHTAMVLNLIVAAGKVRFVAFTDGHAIPQEFVLGPDIQHGRLTVTPGTWLAFQGLGNTTGLVLNLASIEHDPAEAENRPLDHFAFSWIAAA